MLMFPSILMIIVLVQNCDGISNESYISTIIHSYNSSASKNYSDFFSSIENTTDPIEHLNEKPYHNKSIDIVVSDENIPEKSKINEHSTSNLSITTKDEFGSFPRSKNIGRNESLKHKPIDSAGNHEKNDPSGNGIALSKTMIFLKELVKKMEDSICKNQSLQMITGLENGNPWAIKMYDSSATSSDGFLSGSKFQLGNFDECLDTENDVELNSSEPGVETQYCLARMIPNKISPKRTGLREDSHWAFCVPASCSVDHVQAVASMILTTQISQGKVTVEPTYCHSNKPSIIETKDILFVSFLGCFLVFLILCTCYHVYVYIKYKNKNDRTESVKESMILSFSLIRNIKATLSVEGKSKLGLDLIHGVKVFSLSFILPGHTLLFTVPGPVMNADFTENIVQRVETSLMLNSFLLVDTFLILSAFLMCRLFLYELEKQGRVNLIRLYILRYTRLTFAYAVVIALYVTWLDKLGSGPLWDSKMAIEKERCLNSWWINLLYINNYVNTDKMCIFQSWQLCVDTQLYFLAPALIYPVWKWPRIGEYIIGGCTLLTAMIPFGVTYWYNLDATFLIYPKELTDLTSNHYFNSAYIKTHMRCGVYCVGLVFGYILFRIQKSGYKFTKLALISYWSLSAIGIISSVFSVTIFYQPDYVYNPLIAAAYSSIHRFVWSVSFGWIMIACATENGGFVNKFFSWKGFIILGRLSYCAYLVNGVVELYAYGTSRDSKYLSLYYVITYTFSNLAQTFILAFIWSIIFENPILGFKKILVNLLDGKHQTGQSKNIVRRNEA